MKKGKASSALPFFSASLSRPADKLEVDAQTELHLPGIVCLTCNHAPPAGLAGARILIQAGGGIIWLEVIQDVSHESVEGESHTLIDLGLFGDGQVQIPAREATNAACATTVPIHTEDRPPEVLVHRVWVGIGIQPRGVASAAGSVRGHVCNGTTCLGSNQSAPHFRWCCSSSSTRRTTGNCY